MRAIGTRLRNSFGSWSRRALLASFLACGVLVSLAPAASAATFSNPAPIAIPGGGSTASNAPAAPYPSPINVTGFSNTETITDVNVTLNNYSHQFSGDTHVVLVPPGSTGQNILLMAGAGGSAAVSNVNITLDDASTTPLPGTAFSSATYKPTARSTTGVFPAPGPGNNFCSPGIASAGTPSYIGGNCSLATALNGSAPNGEWKLYVIDIGAPDTGVLAGGWTLDITAGGPVATPQQLNVTKNGTGTGGTVRGLGISCPTACSKAYNNNTSVTLTATGDAFNSFTGFSGCDTTTATTCTVSMTAAKNVTATFAALPRTLSVGKVGSGSGTVTGTGISCGADCEQTYPTETSVVLTATPAAGSRFAGWIGCEAPNGNRCTVSMTRNKNVSARFTQNPIYPLPPVYPKPTPTPTPSAGGKTINGTPGRDTINGTPGNDVINCGAGDDVVNAGGGDDVINCGAGNDRINGGAGNDRIDGGSGNDLISGNEGNDRIAGGSGNERANGNSGNDRVGGGSGNDRVGGQSGRDTLNGDSGRDKVSGGSGNDRASGGSGNDRVNGDSGNDRVNGGSGRDALSGGTGNDSISARDRTRDRVNCGRGRDSVSADRRRGRDRVSRNCERVRRR